MSSFRTIQVVNVRWFNATAWYGVELARLLNAAGHESRVVALEGTDTFRKAQELGLGAAGPAAQRQKSAGFSPVLSAICGGS